jgi:centromere-localized protein 2
MEDELQTIQEDTASALARLDSTVGSLSNLRYGRFPQLAGSSDDLAERVVERLDRLQQVCNDVGQQNPAA